MAKINVKGINMYLYKNAGATPLALVPTGITNASPAVVTVADTTGAVAGDPVKFATTGFDELDGNQFVVGVVTATSFEVLGADLSATTGALGATPTATLQIVADRVKLCLSSVDIAAPAVNQIDTSTFCEDSTMAGKSTPGQITFGGFVENNSAAFDELILADSDGLERTFLVVMSGSNGYLIGSISFAGLGYEMPLEGAVAYTITGAQTQKISYVH